MSRSDLERLRDILDCIEAIERAEGMSGSGCACTAMPSDRLTESSLERFSFLKHAAGSWSLEREREEEGQDFIDTKAVPGVLMSWITKRTAIQMGESLDPARRDPGHGARWDP